MCVTKKQLCSDAVSVARCVEAELLDVFNAADSLIAASYTHRTRTHVFQIDTHTHTRTETLK